MKKGKTISIALIQVICPECRATARDIMPGGECGCGGRMVALDQPEAPPVTEFVEQEEPR